jgi:hypothetical protein
MNERERQLRTPRAYSVPVRVLEIIDGADLGNGLVGIEYAGSVSPPTVYDPDVDTTYVTGMGNAYLWTDGVLSPNRVLVRHDAAGAPWPILEGMRFPVAGIVSVTAGDGSVMTCYRPGDVG